MESCFENVGNLIEKEHKECRGRFDNLDKLFMKFRIGRVYEDKKQAIKNYLEKDKNKNSRGPSESKSRTSGSQ